MLIKFRYFSSPLSTNKFIEDIYKNEIIPNDDCYKKVFGNDYVILDLEFDKIPEKTLVEIFTNEKEYRKIFDSVGQSIAFARLDYFKKVIKLAVDKCSKNEESKKSFRNFISDKTYFLLNEQINALLEYKNVFNFDKLV